jgi:hypothetical protein
MKSIFIGMGLITCLNTSQAVTVFEANFNTASNSAYAQGNSSTPGFHFFPLINGGTAFDSGVGASGSLGGMAGAGLRQDPNNTGNQWVEFTNANNPFNYGSFFVQGGLSFVSGQTYTVAFDYRGEVGYHIQEQGSINGVPNIDAVASNVWTTYSQSYTYTSGSGLASLNFNVLQSPANASSTVFSSIDNISITTSVSSVPEPSEWALMLAGLGLMSAIARWRRGRTYAV